jgi:hypothetical protein
LLSSNDAIEVKIENIVTLFSLKIILIMEFDDYFRGTFDRVWKNCFEVWQHSRRVEDFPHGIRRPLYIPSFAKELGIRFAEIYWDRPDPIFEKLYSTNTNLI